MPRIEVPGREDIVGIRAANPGPFTLSGTNSWIVGCDPAWLIDPGPAIGEHLAALVEELGRRGGPAGIALTHGHPDHAEAVPALRERFDGIAVAAARWGAQIAIKDGMQLGPLTAVPTPGHAPDHFAFVTNEVAFTGDAVLGEGSVFIAPDPGAMSAYLTGLERLRAIGLRLLCPGHGPVLGDAKAKLDEYIAHRLDRERRLLAALDAGHRTVDALLDEVWSEVPPALRPAAALTLAAHLDKLAEEGRLPAGVERPSGFSASENGSDFSR